MNQFIEKLSHLVIDVIGISRHLGDGSRRLSALSGKSMESIELVNGAVEEIVSLSESNAAAVRQTNAGVAEMSATSVSVAQAARTVRGVVGEDDRFTKDVARKLEEVVSDIEAVSARSQENRAKMSALAEGGRFDCGFRRRHNGICVEQAPARAERRHRGGKGRRGGTRALPSWQTKSGCLKNPARCGENVLANSLSGYAGESIKACGGRRENAAHRGRKGGDPPADPEGKHG